MREAAENYSELMRRRGAMMVNDEGFANREDLPKRELKDGDRVRFMLLVGGG